VEFLDIELPATAAETNRERATTRRAIFMENSSEMVLTGSLELLVIPAIDWKVM
jgi:hypothetical protein